MREEILSMPSGQFLALVYHCDTCKYAKKSSADHVQSTDTKYKTTEEVKADADKVKAHSPAVTPKPKTASQGQANTVPGEEVTTGTIKVN